MVALSASQQHTPPWIALPSLWNGKNKKQNPGIWNGSFQGRTSCRTWKADCLEWLTRAICSHPSVQFLGCFQSIFQAEFVSFPGAPLSSGGWWLQNVTVWFSPGFRCIIKSVLLCGWNRSLFLVTPTAIRATGMLIGLLPEYKWDKSWHGAGIGRANIFVSGVLQADGESVRSHSLPQTKLQGRGREMIKAQNGRGNHVFFFFLGKRGSEFKHQKPGYSYVSQKPIREYCQWHQRPEEAGDWRQGRFPAKCGALLSFSEMVSLWNHLDPT